MRQWIALAIVAAVIGLMAIPALASGASTAFIDVTASGSELSVTCNQTLWAVGIVGDAFTSENTGITWGSVTNATSEAIKLTVHGNEMVDIATGVGVVWDLDGDGTPVAGDFSMRVGLDDDDDLYDYWIEDWSGSPFLFLSLNGADDTLDASASWSFGLEFISGGNPGLGNEDMVMTNNAGTSHATADADNGLTITASIPA